MALRFSIISVALLLGFTPSVDAAAASNFLEANSKEEAVAFVAETKGPHVRSFEDNLGIRPPSPADMLEKISLLQSHQPSHAQVKASYIKAPAGSACDPIEATIKDQNECKAASNQVGHSFAKAVYAARGRPAGCFWDRSGQSYFNLVDVDFQSGWHGMGSICKATATVALSKDKSTKAEGEVAQGNTQESIRTLDANKDGAIQKEEVVAYAKMQGFDSESATAEFDALDANRDGILDESEVARSLQATEAGSQNETDSAQEDRTHEVAKNNAKQNLNQANKDVSEDEEVQVAKSQGEQNLKQVDKDASKEMEVQAAESDGTKNSDQSERDVADDMDVQAEQWLKAVDLNEDGIVDATEVATFAAKQGFDSSTVLKDFVGLDADHDGVLNAQDVENVFSMVNAPLKGSLGAELTSSEGSAVEDSQMHTKTSVEVLADELSHEARVERDAQALTNKAQEYRSQSEELIRTALSDAFQAAENASQAKTEELIVSLAELEDRASQAEVEAAAMRAKLQAETRKAKDFMAIAEDAMNHLQAYSP